MLDDVRQSHALNEGIAIYALPELNISKKIVLTTSGS